MKQTNGLPVLSEAAQKRLLDGIRVLWCPDAHVSDAPEPSGKSLLKALTADANLEAFGFRLDDRSVRRLAQAYDAGSSFDPAGAVAALDAAPVGRPMYPDFPYQVLGMDEAEFRLHQMLHYCSTYGVEFIARCLGIHGFVEKGWRPDVDETAKTHEDEVLLKVRVLTLTFGIDEAADVAYRMIACKNMRMEASDRALLAELPVPEHLSWQDIPFHENALWLIAQACSALPGKTVEDSVAQARRFCQHPGDVLKAVVLDRAESNPLHKARPGGRPSTASFPTAKRRRYVSLLESFPVDAFRENLADSQDLAKRALGMLSFGRFSKSPAHAAVVDELRDGTLTSWNARMEEAFCDPDPERCLAVLMERPGVAVRNVVRMLAHGVPADRLEEELGVRVANLSRATLVTNANAVASSEWDEVRSKRFQKRGLSAPEQLAQLETLRKQASGIFARLLERGLDQLETPLRGKRVYVDEGDYFLDWSLVSKAASQDGEQDYSSGMAFRIPSEAKVIRAFVFWNDQEKRVDLDLHSYDDEGGHVGWDASYTANGITCSGDVTDSDNAAEYIDVDIEYVLATGVRSINQEVRYFNGESFTDVQSAVAGVLVVGDTEPNAALYTGKNVLGKTDLTKMDCNRARLCFINLEERVVMPMSKVREKPLYSAANLLEAILRSQGAQRVEDRDEADMVLCVGRGAQGEVSLIDNGWFCL